MSCNLKLPPNFSCCGSIEEPTVSFEDKETKPVVTDEASALMLGLTPERFREIKAYTLELHRKYPHMKPGRIQRKVAEHFKIKLT